MNKEIFKTDRYFTVFDFMISHGQLLFRASKDDENLRNIDIIFFGVRYIQLFTSLFGVSIRLADGSMSAIKYDSVSTFLKREGNHLFEIVTKKEKFYVGASYFKVFENEMEFNETSLGLDKNKVRGKEIASSC